MECRNCYWYGKCGEHEPCEDYTALDDRFLMDDYDRELKERGKEYQGFVEEMNS